ncbi:restriction endonuclease subunit S [Chryseobacterium mucoviscidosis]|uniref:restriction endonuclease subunit S n=1 Tax=Chryseobacterium mucoviscidosis TaxID=1945581 RepID=UPI003019A65C
MRSEFIIKLLGDIGKVRMCKRVLKNQTSESEKIPFFKISTFGNIPDTFISEELFDDFIKKYSFPKKGDVLISAAGTVGKTVIYDGKPAYFQDSNIVWIENDENIILNKFLYYFYQTKPWQTTNGSTIVRIYNEDLKSIKVIFPKSIKCQRKIASVLSALDDKIELNNRINAGLEAMAKTLYDYWFVQFDFPIVTSSGVEKPYKTSGGKMVYNQTLKREIPEGWEVTVFNDWIKNTKAGDWGKETIEGNYIERVYCIRGADINGINGKGEVKAPERFILKSNSSKKLLPNDFVVEISGGSPVQSTGRIALITESTLERFDTDIICSNFCKAVSIKDEKYIYNFKQEWQRLYDAGIFFGFEGKTSGIKNFLFDSFMNSYSIVLPQKEIVEKYYEFAKSIDKKIQSNLKQNQELSALRDWLLPMLMNGQVKVGEAEEQVLGMVAKPDVSYNRSSQKNDDELFEKWLEEEGLAARGAIDRVTLRELFDAMDDEDKY